MKFFRSGEDREADVQRYVYLTCDSATCDYSTRGNIVKKGRGGWKADSDLEQNLIQHHLNTGGGGQNHTMIAHGEFTGYDEDGGTIYASASSYGVNISA